MRTKRILVSLVALLLVVGGLPAAEREEASGLVVHEWGVLTRKNTFPESVGAPEALLNGLPGFVGRHAGYKPQQEFRPWRKPVLHFYGKEQEIAVDILTPSGRPVAYWPMPMLLEETFWIMGDGLKDAVGMRWEGTLRKEKPGKVKRVSDDHWWAKIREVDGLWLEMAEASERFLFYEGTGISEPAVRGTIEGGELVLENRDSRDSGRVLVIVNDGENRFLKVVETIAAKGVAALEKAKLMAEPVTREALGKAAREQWVSYGMTEEEAAMIVSVWEEDLWENKGFLVVSRMPSEIYDTYIFPIDIEPVPDELVRAAVIFDTLPGVEGRLAWLPKLRPEIEKHLAGLGSADAKVREAATTGLAAYGDLAKEVLTGADMKGDLEGEMRVRRLLGKLEGSPAPNLPTHGKGRVREPKVPNENRMGPPMVLEGEVRMKGPGDFVLVHERRGEIPLTNGQATSGLVGKGKVKVTGHFHPPGHMGWERKKEGSPWVFEIAE